MTDPSLPAMLDFSCMISSDQANSECLENGVSIED